MSTFPDNSPTRALEPAGQGARQLHATSLTTIAPRLFAGAGGCLEARRPGPSPQPITSGRPPGRPRVVQPRILDSLSPDDPVACSSRGDLHIINRLLGNTSWFRRTLRQHRLPGEDVLVLGAGGGEFGRKIGAAASRSAGLDHNRSPLPWPRHARWFEADVMGFERWSDYPVVVANLFFHHFDRAGLARIGASLGAHARVVIASDPWRARRTAALFGLLCPLIRAHPVTRHDGRVSIAAGFRGDELACLLKLDPHAWHWQARETWGGSCRLVAVRRRP